MNKWRAIAGSGTVVKVEVKQEALHSANIGRIGTTEIIKILGCVFVGVCCLSVQVCVQKSLSPKSHPQHRCFRSSRLYRCRWIPSGFPHRWRHWCTGTTNRHAPLMRMEMEGTEGITHGDVKWVHGVAQADTSPPVLFALWLNGNDWI